MVTAAQKATKEQMEPEAGRSTAGQKVIVGSKLPMDLEIQLCRKEEFDEEGMGGTRRRVRWVMYGPAYLIRGYSYPLNPPEGFEDQKARAVISNGAALTPGIPKDFFDAWLDQHKTDPMVTNHNIFAATKADAAKGMAKDFKEFDSGLGPLQHGKNADGEPVITDRRAPKKVGGNRTATSAPTTADLDILE
jgi:hypothetical protein